MNTDYVQLLNPVTGRWAKLEVRTGRMVSTKKSPGPYAGVPVLERKHD